MDNFILNNKNGKNIDLESKTAVELIDYLILNHHEYMKVELPRVSKLSYTIRRVHGNTHPELHEVEKTFKNIAEEIKSYIEEQENRFFLNVKEIKKLKLGDKLEVMDIEANNFKNKQIVIKEAFTKLRSQTNSNLAPDDGCETFDLTYSLYNDIEEVINNEFDIENKYLFPKLR